MKEGVNPSLLNTEMGQARKRQEGMELLRGPPAASPTLLGMSLVLTFELRALLLSGLATNQLCGPWAMLPCWSLRSCRVASLSLLFPTLSLG